MSDLVKSLMLGLCLAIGTPALAQDTTTPDDAAPADAPAVEIPAADTPTDDATADDAATDAPAAETPAEAPVDAQAPQVTPELSTGQPVGPQPGDPYSASIHGDWELRCVKTPEGQQDPCQLYQLLQDQGGNDVAEINLFAVPDQNLAAGANIVTPLETLLTRQLVISVDGGRGKTYPFTFCTRIGCFSRIGLTDGDISSFKAGNAGKITIVPFQAPDQTVDLKVSLTGFTAGFAALIASAAPK